MGVAIARLSVAISFAEIYVGAGEKPVGARCLSANACLHSMGEQMCVRRMKNRLPPAVAHVSSEISHLAVGIERPVQADPTQTLTILFSSM